MAKQVYKEETEKRESELRFDVNWNVSETLSFGSNYLREDREKSTMQLFFNDGRWKTERAFIEFLEKPENNVRMVV